MRRETFNQGENRDSGDIYSSHYRYSAKFTTNTSGVTQTPGHGVYEISSVDGIGLWTLKTPTAASLAATSLAVAPGHGMVAGTGGEACYRVAMCDEDFMVAIDDSAGEPEFGDEVGTLANSHKMSLGQTGFAVLAYYSASETALVRPLGGGGSATIQLVQAQSSGSAGVVSVKNIQLKGDVSLSPNFETTGDAYNVNYLKL